MDRVMSVLRELRAAFEITRLRARAATWRRSGVHDVWPGAPSHRTVFIVGCPRSGTTWIRRLVAHHPLVISGPESHAYPQVVGAFADLGLRGTAGWRRVLDRYRRGERRDLAVGLHHWVERPALHRFIAAALADDEHADEAAAERVVRAIFDAYLLARGGTSEHVLLEKTPQHLFWADRILQHDPNALVVEVLRDGRDVCVSMEMRARTQNWSPHERAAQIATWARYVSRGLALRSDPALRDRMLLVRFEDVKAQPLPQAERLLAFMGLAGSHEDLEQAVDAVSIDRHPRKGEGRHVRKGAVGDWQTHFSTEDLALFDREAGPLFEQVGYAREPPGA
jgi:hypothetical protein